VRKHTCACAHACLASVPTKALPSRADRFRQLRYAYPREARAMRLQVCRMPTSTPPGSAMRMSFSGREMPVLSPPFRRQQETEGRSLARARLSSAATRRAVWLLPLRRNGDGVDQYLAPIIHACIASIKRQTSQQGTDQGGHWIARALPDSSRDISLRSPDPCLLQCPVKVPLHCLPGMDSAFAGVTIPSKRLVIPAEAGIHPCCAFQRMTLTGP
jgi:hypothetical protein